MQRDPAHDTSLDLYARMVRRALGVPVALVSLVEADRQVFPGAVGLPRAYQQARQTPLTHSFCQYVVRDEQPLVVTDAREVDVLSLNLAIEDLGVVAYAGWPLTDHTGAVVGSLCAIDAAPHPWSEDELAALSDIAAACSAELAERGRRDLAERARDEAEHLAERSRALLALSEALGSTATLDEIAVAIGRVSREQLGAARAGMWLLPDPAHPLDRSQVTGAALTAVPDRAVDWPAARRSPVLAVGRGNALGAALLDGRALFLADRDAQNHDFPAMQHPEQTPGARAFVPLVVQGRPLGVLVISWPRPRSFSDDDRATVAALTAYTAQAVQRAALLQDRVDVSVTLQRAMLTELPAIAGLELAARYLPAAQRDQVGGDWYDALGLPSGDTMIAVGDVTGHDIAAAAVMGQLRSMLRGIACTVDESPAHSLTRLDTAAGRVQIDTVASLVLAHLRPLDDGRWRLCWSTAGHLSPVLLDASGVVALPPDGRPGGPLLGVDPAAPRHDHEVELEPGSLLLLFTDGLVERRREALDVGLARLHDTLVRHGDRPTGELLDLVLDELVVGADGTHDDDVAVLAVRVGSQGG